VAEGALGFATHAPGGEVEVVCEHHDEEGGVERSEFLGEGEREGGLALAEDGLRDAEFAESNAESGEESEVGSTGRAD